VKAARKVLLFALLVILALVAFHGLLLEVVLSSALPHLARAAGIELKFESIRLRLGEPLAIKGVRVQIEEGVPCRISLDQLVVFWGSPGEWIRGKGQLVRELSIDGLVAAISIPPPTEQALEAAKEGKARAMVMPDIPKFLVPHRINLQSDKLRVKAESFAVEVTGSLLELDLSKPGRLAINQLHLHFGEHLESFAEINGSTEWTAGGLLLDKVVFRRGLFIDHLRLGWEGGLSLSTAADLFGGNLTFGSKWEIREGIPWLAGDLQVGGVSVAEAAGFFGRTAGGVIEQVSVSLQGYPDLPNRLIFDAKLVANDLAWESKPVGSLEVSANGREGVIELSSANALSGSNNLSASGTIKLPIDPENLAASRPEASIVASVPDPSRIAGLFASQLENLQGTLKAELKVHTDDSVDGAHRLAGVLSLSGRDLSWDQWSVAELQASLLLDDEEVSIQQAFIRSLEGSVTCSGTVRLQAPHKYSAEASLDIMDLGAYAELLDPSGSLISGSVVGKWEGYGSAREHHGIVDLDVKTLVAEWAPDGVDANVEASYSPQHLSASQVRVASGGFTLAADLQATQRFVRISQLSLTDVGRVMLVGNCELPLSIFKLIQGVNGWDPSAAARLVLETPEELNLSQLPLLGDDHPGYTGTLALELELSGSLEDPVLGGSLELAGFKLQQEDNTLPSVDAKASLESHQGGFLFSGDVRVGEYPSLLLRAQGPLGFAVGEMGNLEWRNPDGKCSASLKLPKTNLQAFQSFLPSLRRLEGIVAADLEVEGTVAEPLITGQVGIQEGALTVQDGLFPLEDINGSIVLKNRTVLLGPITANVGAAPLRLTGKADFSKSGEPEINLALKGNKVLILRTPDARVRANVGISLAGAGRKGELSGRIDLVDSRFYKRLEVTPLIAPSPAQEARPFVPPKLAGIVPEPFASWAIDLYLDNASDFLITGNLARGSIVPRLHLSGTLGTPMLLGQVDLYDIRAFLPFTTLAVKQGKVLFEERLPFMPILDVSASSEVMDYDVNIFAYGPLDNTRIIMRSNPPLSQEQILLLVTLGVTPGSYAGEGFGRAAAGQGGLLLLRTLGRQIDIPGVDTEELLNRIQVSSNPPRWPGGSPTLQGRVNLWRHLSFVTKQDENGYYNVGLGYRFLFR